MKKLIVILAVVGLLASTCCGEEKLYVKPNTENFRLEPNGVIIGQLFQNTKVKVVEQKGEWKKIQVEGWIWAPSLSSSPAMAVKPLEKSVEVKKSGLIAYKILREWSGGIEVLVDEKTTKAQIMELAKNLAKKYKTIQIFDLREAYLNRDNPNYSSAKYNKHWLVSKWPGDASPQWVAIGRNY